MPDLTSKLRVSEEQEKIKVPPFTGQKKEREERISLTGVINTKTIKYPVHKQKPESRGRSESHSPHAKGKRAGLMKVRGAPSSDANGASENMLPDTVELERGWACIRHANTTPRKSFGRKLGMTHPTGR